MSTSTTTPQQRASGVIDALGGTCATARICGVASSAVAEWRKRGIPKARLEFLRLAFPELPWLEAAGTTPLTAEEVRARKHPSKPPAQGVVDVTLGDTSAFGNPTAQEGKP